MPNHKRLQQILLAMIICFLCPLRARAEFTTNATVLRVIDGDTLKVRYNGRNTPVRLIGIDSPEMRENAKAVRDASKSNSSLQAILEAGAKAYDHLTTLVHSGQEIYLEFDAEKRDKYNRLLAYVWLNKKEMLNEMMLSSGYASQYTHPPNVRYAKLFTSANRAARENQRGLWSPNRTAKALVPRQLSRDNP